MPKIRNFKRFSEIFDVKMAAKEARECTKIDGVSYRKHL